MSFTDRQYFSFAVILYGLSVLYSIFLWRRGFREDNKVNYLLLLAAFLFHSAAMFKRGLSLQQCPVNNLYEATTFITWAMALIYLLFGAWPRISFIGAFASPVLFSIGVFALMPALDHHGPKPEFTGGWLSLHVALFALSYGAFGLSAVAGFMYLSQEHDLKMHRIKVVLSRLPPIQRLEVIMVRLVTLGFALLSLALLVSVVWLHSIELSPSPHFDPKLIWAVLVWLMGLALVCLRWVAHQSVRKFAWGTIGLFVFVALTFWGSSLISPTHNSGPRQVNTSEPSPRF